MLIFDVLACFSSTPHLAAVRVGRIVNSVLFDESCADVDIEARIVA